MGTMACVDEHGGGHSRRRREGAVCGAQICRERGSDDDRPYGRRPGSAVPAATEYSSGLDSAEQCDRVYVLSVLHPAAPRA